MCIYSKKQSRCLIFITALRKNHHFHADPDADPAFQSKSDPDPDLAFHTNSDPDPAPLQSEGNLRPLVYKPVRAPL